MRSDMEKVVVDCARHNHRDRYRDKAHNNNRSWNTDSPHNNWENYPKWEKVGSFRSGTKSQCDRLSPLIRFLRSRVGQPWDAVYAEIAHGIPKDGTMQQHVWDHIRRFVDSEIENRQGRWLTGGSKPERIDGHIPRATGWGDFYVGLDGILHERPPRRRYRRGSLPKGPEVISDWTRGREWRVLHVIDSRTCLAKLEGAWFLLEYQEGLDEYRRKVYWLKSQRTLSKKEIKTLVPAGLR